MAMIIGKAVRGIAGGIGLASESIHAHKESKRARQAYESEDDHAAVTERDEEVEIHNEIALAAAAEDDEEHWELDEAQAELESDEEESPERQKKAKEGTQLADEFIKSHPPPAYSETAESSATATFAQLPLPVLLPQRRPGSRSRGFIRAYAPMLETCGIDQAMWLDFLSTFEKSSQANPWLNAINLAGIATTFMPTAIGIAVGIAIQITTQIAIEVHSRTRTNTFLTKINDSFFRPRGLYCVVLTWKPETAEHFTDVSLAATIGSSFNKSGATPDTAHKLKNKFRSSDGKTYGDLEFLETAPLVYPGLDKLADKEGEEAKNKREKMKNAKTFVSGYMDKRAQAKYAMNNPDSTLSKNTPQATFTSRYADPSHPASSGNLVSLVTGGKINPPPIGPLALLGGRKEDIAASRGMGGLRRMGLGGGLGARGGIGGRRGGLGGLGLLAQSIADARRSSGQHNFGTGSGMTQPMNAGDIRGQREVMMSDPRGFDQRTSAYPQDYAQAYPQDYAQAYPQAYRRQGLGGTGPRSGVGPLGGVKKLLKQDVLYLMIVNMPTEEEMAEAQAMMGGAAQH